MCVCVRVWCGDKNRILKGGGEFLIRDSLKRKTDLIMKVTFRCQLIQGTQKRNLYRKE